MPRVSKKPLPEGRGFFDGLCGLILAGGRGRRLGGVEKGLQLWHGHPLVSWSAQALRPHCKTLLISANRCHDAYQPWANEIISDGLRDDAGPLAGLEAGLQWAGHQGFAGVLVMPCDTPNMDAALMGIVAERAIDWPDRIVVFRQAARLQPLHGYYPASLSSALTHYLTDGGRRVEAFVTAQTPITIDRPPDDSAFANLNRAQDWPPGA